MRNDEIFFGTLLRCDWRLVPPPPAIEVSSKMACTEFRSQRLRFCRLLEGCTTATRGSKTFFCEVVSYGPTLPPKTNLQVKHFFGTALITAFWIKLGFNCPGAIGWIKAKVWPSRLVLPLPVKCISGSTGPILIFFVCLRLEFQNIFYLGIFRKARGQLNTAIK